MLTLLVFTALANAALPACYQELAAEQKQAALWTEIAAQPYAQLPALDEGGGPTPGQIFGSGIHGAFTSPTDEIVEGRKKIIHKWGSAVQVTLDADPRSPFTGLFATGAPGIARLSLALPFTPGGAFVPGLALKLFVDGGPSVNLTVMEQLEGQDADTNYFRSVFTNILPDPKTAKTKFGTWAFEGFVENAIHLGVEHVAAVGLKGERVDAPVAPYQLLFKPLTAISSRADDFRVELAKLAPGTALYEIFGKMGPEKNSPVARIGVLRTTSAFVASRYGDEKLYFQHAGTSVKSGYILRWLHGPK